MRLLRLTSFSTQRPDQSWVNKLLPSHYRAEYARRTEDALFGGLNGDLAILIAILAFSAYDGATCDVLEYSVRGVHGPNGGWKMHNRHDEEGCRLSSRNQSWLICFRTQLTIIRGRQARLRRFHLDVATVFNKPTAPLSRTGYFGQNLALTTNGVR
jgi:hypothetical protein